MSVLITPRNALNLAVASLAAALMSGCSSDTGRFSDPFSNPFSSSSTVSQNQPNSYSGAPVARVRTQSLPSRSSTVAYNDPEPRASRPTRVAGGAKGWSTAGGTAIVVARGETVGALADRYGVPGSAIVKANGFASASEIRPGTRLIIPVFRGRGGDTEVASRETSRRHADMSDRERSHERRRVAQRDDDRDDADRPRSRHHRADRDDADDRGHKHKAERLADRDDRDGERRDRKHHRVADRDDRDGDRHERKSHRVADRDDDRGGRSHDRAERKRDREERIADSRGRRHDSAEDDRGRKSSRIASDEGRRSTQDAAPARPRPQQVAARTDATPTGSLSTGGGGGKPEFRWPARGRVIQGFKPGGNDGINIAVPEGTSVKAVEGGVVAYAGSELKGYGNMVLIRHPNGFVSAYANNGQLDVKRGDTVRRGQTIAKSGQSGNVSGPQLHFELRKGSTPVDPSGYLAGT